MGCKDAYTFPKSEAPGIWAEAPGTNPSGNPEPSIMKILSGEYIKASKVGYVRHESNVRDAQILNLTKKKWPENGQNRREVWGRSANSIFGDTNVFLDPNTVHFKGNTSIFNMNETCPAPQFINFEPPNSMLFIAA